MILKHNALPIRLLLGLLLGLSFLSSSCEEDDDVRTIDPDNHVLAVISEQENLSQFYTALQSVDLTSTLQSPNLSFTIFAPTNEAFNSFLQQQGYNSIADVPREALSNLIGYHVSLGSKSASQLDSAVLVNTLAGKDIFVYKTSDDNSTITLNDEVQIGQADIPAVNGFVHTVDKVLVPPAESLAAYVAARAANAEAPAFGLLKAALDRAELFGTLNSNHPFTLLAPTDEAFIAAGYATAEDIQNEDPAVLKTILLYHLLPDYRYSFMFPNGGVSTQLGKKVTFNTTTNPATVTGIGNEQAAVLIAAEQNILTSNGLLHAIDRLLLPQ